MGWSLVVGNESYNWADRINTAARNNRRPRIKPGLTCKKNCNGDSKSIAPFSTSHQQWRAYRCLVAPDVEGGHD